MSLFLSPSPPVAGLAGTTMLPEASVTGVVVTVGAVRLKPNLPETAVPPLGRTSHVTVYLPAGSSSSTATRSAWRPLMAMGWPMFCSSRLVFWSCTMASTPSGSRCWKLMTSWAGVAWMSAPSTGLVLVAEMPLVVVVWAHVAPENASTPRTRVSRPVSSRRSGRRRSMKCPNANGSEARRVIRVAGSAGGQTAVAGTRRGCHTP